jgi:hypothetical protein
MGYEYVFNRKKTRGKNTRVIGIQIPGCNPIAPVSSNGG